MITLLTKQPKATSNFVASGNVPKIVEFLATDKVPLLDQTLITLCHVAQQPEHALLLVQFNVVASTVSILQTYNKEEAILSHATRLLSLLLAKQPANQEHIIQVVQHFLSSSNHHLVTHTCYIYAALALACPSQVAKAVLPKLVEVLYHPDAASSAMKALIVLAKTEYDAMITIGVLPALLNFLNHAQESVALDAATILAEFAQHTYKPLVDAHAVALLLKLSRKRAVLMVPTVQVVRYMAEQATAESIAQDFLDIVPWLCELVQNHAKNTTLMENCMYALQILCSKNELVKLMIVQQFQNFALNDAADMGMLFSQGLLDD